MASAAEEKNRNQVLVARLPEMWRTLIRVADDVKETVRKAAQETCARLMKVRRGGCNANIMTFKSCEFLLRCTMLCLNNVCLVIFH